MTSVFISSHNTPLVAMSPGVFILMRLYYNYGTEKRTLLKRMSTQRHKLCHTTIDRVRNEERKRRSKWMYISLLLLAGTRLHLSTHKVVDLPDELSSCRAQKMPNQTGNDFRGAPDFRWKMVKTNETRVKMRKTPKHERNTETIQ